jgi:hypothetical protein
MQESYQILISKLQILFQVALQDRLAYQQEAGGDIIGTAWHLPSRWFEHMK